MIPRDDIDVFGSGEPEDDPERQINSESFTETAPATATSITAIHRRFRRWASDLLNHSAVDQLSLAVYETLANVAEHAYADQPEPGLVHIHAAARDGKLVIRIADRGRWRTPTTSDTHRGRGLHLIHTFADAVDIQPQPHGTTVRICYQLTLSRRAQH